MTGAGEDEAGNIYFTSCECGYGQIGAESDGSLWMLVAADQVPEGARWRRRASNRPTPEKDEREAIAGATPAP